MLIPFGVFSAAGAGGGAAAGAYELIETTTLGSDTTSVTFSSIVGTYKHLQIRLAARTDRGATIDAMTVIFNSDTATNYSDHYLYGDGSAVSSGSGTTQANMETFYLAGNTTTANSFGAGVIDILDYASTSKNKTIRAFGGVQGTVSIIGLHSGSWRSTSAVTSITLDQNSGTNFKTGSRFSLYGIKG